MRLSLCLVFVAVCYAIPDDIFSERDAAEEEPLPFRHTRSGGILVSGRGKFKPGMTSLVEVDVPKIRRLLKREANNPLLGRRKCSFAGSGIADQFDRSEEGVFDYKYEPSNWKNKRSVDSNDEEAIFVREPRYFLFPGF